MIQHLGKAPAAYALGRLSHGIYIQRGAMLDALPITTTAMAKTTISHELAAKYPEFKGRFGETVDTSEVQSVLRAHGDAPTVGEQVAAKKARTATPASTPAPAAAPAPAKRVRAPRKTTAKKTR